MLLSKKIITLILGLLVFLVPISFGINDIESIHSGEQIISITTNNAYAINLNCDDGLFGVTGIGCRLTEGLLSFYELIIFYFTQIIVVLIGVMLDIFIFLSIDSQFYRSGLIEAGWEILRDFTNIVFIFALLLTAFKMVLGQDEANNKRVLVKTILVALVINFSLFVTYAIIDSSNILAHTLYNRIDATANTYNTSSNSNGGNVSQVTISTKNGTTTTNLGASGNDGNGLGSGESSLSGLAKSIIPQDAKNLSIAIAGKINPQQIVNSSSGGKETGALQAFIIITGAGLLNILLGWLFISMILIFVGRAIGLMVSAILAPVAFASIVVPGLQNKSYIGFNKWLPELISLAFLAPVYMFFLYLVISFLGNEGFLASINASPGTGILESMLKAYIPFIIVGGLLILAKKISTSMAGELGGMAVKGAQSFTGALVAGAAIAATGGAAAVGTTARLAGGATNMVGKGMQKFGGARSKLRGESLSKMGSLVAGHGKYMQSARINPTNSKIFNAVAGDQASKYIGKVTGKSAIGHVDNALNGAKVVDNEYSDLQKAKVKRAKENAQAKIDGSKNALDWQKEIDNAKEKEVLEKAKEDAEKAKEDAENKFEKDLQDAKQKESQESQKLENPAIQKELKGIQETLEKNGAEEKQIQKDLDVKLTEQNKLGPKEKVNESSFASASVQAENAAINSRNKKRENLASEIKSKQTEMKSVQDIIEKSTKRKNEITKDKNKATKERQDIENNKKTAGKSAENTSRAQSAKELTSDTISISGINTKIKKNVSVKDQRTANKIIENKGLKTAEEKVIEKLIKQSEKSESTTIKEEPKK